MKNCRLKHTELIHETTRLVWLVICRLIKDDKDFAKLAALAWYQFNLKNEYYLHSHKGYNTPSPNGTVCLQKNILNGLNKIDKRENSHKTQLWQLEKHGKSIDMTAPSLTSFCSGNLKVKKLARPPHLFLPVETICT